MQSKSITVVSIQKFLELSIKDSSITVSFTSIKMIAINFRKDMISELFTSLIWSWSWDKRFVSIEYVVKVRKK